MPRSVYFSQAVKSEQNLYEDLVIESLKIYGQDVYYLPREIVNRDYIFGEDPASQFDDAYMIEAYIENTDGFEGAGDLYSKFGLEIRDEATFIVSRRQWERLIGLFNNTINGSKPNMGDIIYLPMSSSFFEITQVESDKPFYQLSNLPVYKLSCSLFEMSDEKFNTGVDGIDLIAGKSAYQLVMDLSVTAGQHLEIGETVTQILDADLGISVFGTVQTVTKISNLSSTISISNIGVSGIAEAKSFIVSGSIGLVGAESGNTCYITKIYDVTDQTGNFNLTDSQSSNSTFEFEGDSILDFSESNPFGDPSETY
jgi:hypothetical protein